MPYRLLASALLIALAGHAAAQATAPDATGAAPAAAPAAPEAAASAAVEKTAAAAPQQRCHREYPTGSNLPKTVCESADDSQHARELDDLKQAMIRSSAARVRTPGGS